MLAPAVSSQPQDLAPGWRGRPPLLCPPPPPPTPACSVSPPTPAKRWRAETKTSAAPRSARGAHATCSSPPPASAPCKRVRCGVHPEAANALPHLPAQASVTQCAACPPLAALLQARHATSARQAIQPRAAAAPTAPSLAPRAPSATAMCARGTSALPWTRSAWRAMDPSWTNAQSAGPATCLIPTGPG